MTVESATYISDLDETLPLDANVFSEGDDHTRLLKDILQNTLDGLTAGFTSPVLATEADLNNLIGITSNINDQLTEIVNSQIPKGGIVPFTGTIASVSTPFAICDGNNGTPNLTNMFVFPASIEADLGTTGGSDNQAIIEHSHDATHLHTGLATVAGDHAHNFEVGTVGSIGDPDLAGAVATPSAQGRTEVEGLHGHTTVIDNITLNTDSSGVSATDANLPPYVHLGFKMRVV